MIDTGLNGDLGSNERVLFGEGDFQVERSIAVWGEDEAGLCDIILERNVFDVRIRLLLNFSYVLKKSSVEGHGCSGKNVVSFVVSVGQAMQKMEMTRKERLW